MHGRRSLVLACAAPWLFVAAAGAQARGSRGREPVRGWELPGLDIRPNGGWRVRARAVAAARARLLAQRNFSALNAASVGPAAINAVTGVLRVPVIMFRYQDSPPAQYARDTAEYNATLFASAPPGGKPYTLRTYYEQLSNGLFSIQGAAVGWVALAGAETTYTGTPGSCPGNPYGTNNCNGLFGGNVQAGLVEAVQHADSQIDFGQFDNDGPDGIPNSGDDDGAVDAVVFLHPSVDGACINIPGNNHLWSHRSSIFVQTNDSAHNGGKILVEDYILQSGLGSPLADGSPCDSTAIMPIGTAAHELGHLLALPDLYDNGGPTEGIGEYSLMGSGNYKSGNSPARYDAWSLQQMGWTTVEPITTSGTYTVGPVPTADTVFYVNVQGANPRNEYFLIENRQEVQSDSAMLNFHCVVRSGNPPGCGGGLLVYHVDDTKACMINVCGGNTMNSGSIHGLVVEEADGLRQLWNDVNGDNRGDGGDPYPGTTGNTAFSFDSKPAAIKNVDSSFVGFTIDSISQVAPNGAMAFRLRFGGVTVVQASDTAALIVVDGDSQHVFRSMLEDGSSHTIAVADTQLTADARSRFVFQSWSDGGAISHSVTGSVAGTTYTAALAAEHRLNVTVLGSGTVGYNPVVDSNGVLVAQGTPVALTATAAPPFAFGGWFGDTTASTPVLVLPMGRPFDLTVRFDPVLAIASGDPRPGGIMGKAYVDTLHATGGTGNYSWQLVQDSLPPGLTFAVTGRISGTPRQTGTWTFTVRATSGAQQVLRQLSITITAPTLAASAVVAQLLTGASTLSSDDVNYLQLLGNKDGLFDVGDFLAWVRASGATPVPPTATRAGGGRQP